MCESETNVEDDRKTKAPIDLHVRIIGQIKGQVITSVLLTAACALQALLSYHDLIVATLILWGVERTVLLLRFVEADIDLMT